jgi:tripartite-type tricarboxylate transporter receptor subunit TctC
MAKAQMEKIVNTMREIANDPTFRARNLTERGLEPVFSAPDDFAEFLKQDRVTAKKVVDAAGLQPQ